VLQLTSALAETDVALMVQVVGDRVSRRTGTAAASPQGYPDPVSAQVSPGGRSPGDRADAWAAGLAHDTPGDSGFVPGRLPGGDHPALLPAGGLTAR
jgi:hypothetical protein